MLVSEKVVFAITSWILISLLITGDSEVEIFLVLVAIGFVAVRELSSSFITAQLKQKLNIFIYVFIFVFTILVGIRIIKGLGF